MNFSLILLNELMYSHEKNVIYWFRYENVEIETASVTINQHTFDILELCMLQNVFFHVKFLNLFSALL